MDFTVRTCTSFTSSQAHIQRGRGAITSGYRVMQHASLPLNLLYHCPTQYLPQVVVALKLTGAWPVHEAMDNNGVIACVTEAPGWSGAQVWFIHTSFFSCCQPYLSCGLHRRNLVGILVLYIQISNSFHCATLSTWWCPHLYKWLTLVVWLVCTMLYMHLCTQGAARAHSRQMPFSSSHSKVCALHTHTCTHTRSQT